MRPRQKEIERQVNEALSWLNGAIRIAKQIPEVDTVKDLRAVVGQLSHALDVIEDRHDAEDALRREREGEQPSGKDVSLDA
jgi:hypothetical protein